MRVLLDENLDWRLKRSFDSSFEVRTVRDVGYSGLQNGKLLRAAAPDFDVFVTLDRNLQYQQDLASLDLAVVVIRSVHSRRREIEPLMGKVNEAVRQSVPGRAIVVAR